MPLARAKPLSPAGGGGPHPHGPVSVSSDSYQVFALTKGQARGNVNSGFIYTTENSSMLWLVAMQALLVAAPSPEGGRLSRSEGNGDRGARLKRV
jgi:hypothetical protein